MKDLYLLQDGTHADPGDCSKGKDGLLRHKNGLAVCLYEDGTPQTVEKDAVINKNVQAAKMGDKPVAPAASAEPTATATAKVEDEGVKVVDTETIAPRAG